MSLVIEAPPVPLRIDERGVLRVGKTRVPLEANGLIERTPGQARSIRVLVPREELPDLD